MKKHDIFLWILFAVLVLYRCTETIYDGWLVLAFISCVIAVVLLVKNKLPSSTSCEKQTAVKKIHCHFRSNGNSRNRWVSGR